jgi:hypothetical protein
MILMVPFLSKKNSVHTTVSNSRSLLIFSLHILSHLFFAPSYNIMHVFISLVQSANLSYITTLAFSYPYNVGYNLGQQREQLNIVITLRA